MVFFQLKGVTGTAAEKYYEFVDDRPFNDIRYSINMTKLRQLGWQSRTSWDEGINETSLLNILNFF